MAKEVQKRSQPPKLSKLFDEIERTKMRIIGMGGGGCNIVSEISQRLKRSDFVAANTDLQALRNVSRRTKKFAFGQQLTKGLGCGMDALLGFRAAQEDRERIKKLLEGQDLCVLVATLGGGTGSGAAPVFAEVCQELKNLTIGIFTMPFSFEGEKRKQVAFGALEKLKPLLNAYVIIENDKIFQIVEKNAPLKVALSSVNRNLAESLEGFIETLFLPGLINTDFADVKALLQGRGRLAYLAAVNSQGEDRVKLALDQVLANPLYGYQSRGAERILFNIAGSKDVKMEEVAQISKKIFEQNPRAKIIFGISSSQQFRNKLRIMVFAIGCEEHGGALLSRPLKIFAKEERPAQNTRASKPVKKEARPKQQSKKKQPPKGGKRQNQKTLPPPLKNEGMSKEKQRRNALDVKKAIEEEIEELQEREKVWDTPAFLRFGRAL